MADQAARIAALERQVQELSHISVENQRLRERADREAQRANREAQRADREEQKRRDATATAALLKRRMMEMEEERRLEQDTQHEAQSQDATQKRLEELERRHKQHDKQPLRQYIWQVSSLHQHVSRVIPLPVPATSKTTKSAKSAPKDPASSTKTTTSKTMGQTSIVGKYYPLQVRRWTGFAEQIGPMLAQLDRQLGDREVFPSSAHAAFEEERLMEGLPNYFLNIEYYYNANRTSFFVGATLERPSSKVLAEYFAASGHAKAVFFDNMTAGVRAVPLSMSQSTELMTLPDPASESDMGQPANPSPSGSADSAEEEASDSSPTAARKRTVQKTLPDCIVLSVDLPYTASDDDSRRRVIVGEHKSCHALRAADLAALEPLASDSLVRLAVAMKARKEKKKQKELRKTLYESGAPVPERGREAPAAVDSAAKGSPTALAPLQVFFASALAQAYHYMLLSGLAYGYLASGETLTFLHIPESEPTALLYHTSFFPGVAPQDLPQQNGQPLFPHNVTSPSSTGPAPVDDTAWTAAANASAIMQMCGLCLLAFSAPIRDVDWTSNAATQLAGFPSLPLGLRRRYSTSVSPIGVRRRDDDPDDNDNKTDSDNGSSDRGPRRRGRVARLRSEQGRAPSPLRQTDNAAETSHAATADPDCAYCTQACLLGLARGQALDAGCPNYALHAAAATATDKGKVEDKDSNRHAITAAEVRWLLCKQLRRSVKENCWCLYDEGARGAIGCLFKIRLSGYGYTFVAKGVERMHAHKLRHESRIYRALQAQQGVLVPVHLGLVKLLAPYPLMQRFAALTHFMLMSHAGVVLHHGPQLDALSEELGRDLEDEIALTYDELLDWGVDDFDENVYNATWCEEVQRVMKFDFDHAQLNRAVYEKQKLRCAADADAANEDDAADGRKRKHDAAIGQDPTAKRTMHDV